MGPLVDEKLAALKATREKEIYVRPGAVPGSLSDLKVGDADDNRLYAVTCIREDITDYMKVVRKSGFTCQPFDYDYAAHEQKE